MRNTTTLLADYAAYHRDPRNIATHAVGVPLIVFGVAVLLARFGVDIGAWHATGACLAFAVSAAWYLTRGHLGIGVAVTAAVGALVWLAHLVAGGSTANWLAWGLGTFAVGWAIQFVGHHFEGKKPAFVDDLVGLLIGPMFVVAELLFALGLCRAVHAEIERRAGPVRKRVAHGTASGSGFQPPPSA
jgi:uncharacterized membrane protein YGL010W